jgi:hypothetical protein
MLPVGLPGRMMWQSGQDRSKRRGARICGNVRSDRPGGKIRNSGDARGSNRIGKAALGHLLDQGLARLHQIPYGDIWLRDIAPIFVVNRSPFISVVPINPENPESLMPLAALDFAWNGWGEKYLFESRCRCCRGDRQIPQFTDV